MRSGTGLPDIDGCCILRINDHELFAGPHRRLGRLRWYVMSTEPTRVEVDPTDGDRSLPPMLDMDDALDRIERHTDDRAALDRLAEVRDLLDRIAARDPGRRESLVGDLDNLVDVLRTHVDDGGDAAFWAETVRNRIANYRRTRREASDTVHFGSSRLTVGGREAVDPADHRGETGRLRGTLVNGGERGTATVQLAFYDGSGTATWTIESHGFDLDAGERRSVDLHVWIPEDADHYGVVALDTDDPRTTGEPPTLGH